MNIKPKFKLSKKKYPNYGEKITLKFDITMLNMIIGYLFKDSRIITRKTLINLRNLFDLLDERSYEVNEKIWSRFNFIKRALKARLDLGMENKDIVVNFCRSDSNDPENEEIINSIPVYTKINYDEIRYINKAIADRLRYCYLFYYKNQIYETIEKLDSGDYDSFQEINDEMLEICKSIIAETRKIKVMDDICTLSLSDEDFDDNIIDIVNSLKDPSKILKTGIKLLNQILAPGFMSKRLYMFMGLPAGFKSGILLKVARDIKLYNKGVPTKKVGKRKTILFITMENEVDESFERLFNMTITPEDIRNYTPKQVLKMIKENKEFVLNDQEDIDIVFKYFPYKSINTEDLYTIIDDIEDEGREVITLILDYIKRIRSTERAESEKEELKNVTNELKNLAIEKDISIITAHQLNRGAATVVDSALEANKEDLARFVGRSNVGSAWEVIENSDWVCIINVEQKRGTKQFYLTLKRVKIRYRDPNDLTYFNHPFELGNKMKLLDDIHLDRSLSEISLASDFDAIEMDNRKGKRTATTREVVDDGDDFNDLFDFSSSINK